MDDYKPLTPQELDRGYFFLTHRELIKKIIMALVIFVLIILYAFMVFRFINLFQGGSWQNMALQTSQNYDWASHHQQRAPQPLEVTGTQLISLGNRRYNLVAFVNNPNLDWAIKEAQYRFVVNGEPLDSEYSFINPGEKRIIVNSSYQASDTVNSLEFNFGNLAWQRVADDYQDVNWQISETNYYPATRQTEGDRTFEVPARVTWQARNMSLYDFWEVNWQVILLNNDKIVGIQEIISKDFSSLEKRELETIWLNPLPRVTSAEVFPIFDNLDSNNYKTLETNNGGSLGL